MFCSECGQQAAGKFCSHCGTALARSQPLEQPSTDWQQSIDYELVCRADEVRTAIKRAEAQAREGVSSSKLLEMADGVATSFTFGLSSIAIAKLVQPIYSKCGLNSSKERSEFLSLPPGRVLASLAVAVARQGLEVTDVQQQTDACALAIRLPADLRSLEGKLLITIRHSSQGTHVAAQVRIDGQWYDWGACNRRLDQLFGSLGRVA